VKFPPIYSHPSLLAERSIVSHAGLKTDWALQGKVPVDDQDFVNQLVHCDWIIAKRCEQIMESHNKGNFDYQWSLTDPQWDYLMDDVPYGTLNWGPQEIRVSSFKSIEQVYGIPLDGQFLAWINYISNMILRFVQTTGKNEIPIHKPFDGQV